MSAATLPTPTRPDPYLDADGQFEVVNCVRVEKPMSVFEQTIATLLIGRRSRSAERTALDAAFVETTFRIPGSGNDRKPDVAFLSYQRWPAARGTPKTNAWPIAPDLAVEVISPTDKLFDVYDKLREYFSGGVRQVWRIISNIEQVYIFDSPTAVRILTRADELTGDPIIPGFRMALDDLFPLAEQNS